MKILELGAVNWLAVGACVLLMLALRARMIWFAPPKLYPVLWERLGIERTDAPKLTPLSAALVIAASFVQAVFLALFINAIGNFTGEPDMGTGGLAGMMLGLGAVAPAKLVDKVFSGQYASWVSESINHFMLYITCGLILGAWR